MVSCARPVESSEGNLRHPLEVHGMGVSASVGTIRRLRWQIDRKNPSFRQASWALAALAVARGAWLVRSGRGADTGAYFVCLASSWALSSYSCWRPVSSPLRRIPTRPGSCRTAW